VPNYRKQTKGLTTNQVKDLNAAWHHAATIGRPLNRLLTIRPIDVDDLDPARRCELFAAFRNKLSVYARQHNFPPTFVWSREANPDGLGEHLHVLMHVPRRFHEDFQQTVEGWMPDAAATDVRHADQRTRFTSNGRRLSAITYLLKQMTPQAWYKRGLIRKAGGPILGKRGGTTTNLGRKAIAEFRRAGRNVVPHTTKRSPKRTSSDSSSAMTVRLTTRFGGGLNG
jgi:hypothetical protein